MNKSFIEIYDNAIPDEICNYLVALFDRELIGGYAGRIGDESVKELRTAIDPTESEGKSIYVSGTEMLMGDYNFDYQSVISDLDFVVNKYIFDYNKKYLVWSSKLNMDLVPKEKRAVVEEE